MNKKIFALLPFAAIVAAMLPFSCQRVDELSPSAGEAVSLTVVATLGGSYADTRADDENTGNSAYDNWSQRSFKLLDVLSFYSEHGDALVNEGQGSFVNEPLECVNGDASPFYFRGLEARINPTRLSASAVYMYFPWDKNVANPGMELRRTKGSETAPLRCVDFLTAAEIDAADLKEGRLTGSFEHMFSELIIIRGKGFDQQKDPDKQRITVVLEQGYTHLVVDYSTNPWGCTPRLVNDPSYKRVADARLWDAWQGNNYGITQTDEVGREAWYVLLPTLGTEDERKNGITDRHTTVSYIELYDNDGVLQRVSSLQLAGGNTKMLDSGWRYPMEVIMDELVPTVNPFKVLPWGDNVDITDERSRGIHNATEFGLWQQQYANYLSGGKNEDELLKYGDATIITDTDDNTVTKWHFYLLNDIDFSQYNYDTTASTVIPELAAGDILDGISTTLENHTFVNHRLTNLRKPLVDRLSGTLQNMDFVEPRIELTDDQSTSPVGTLANSITGGTVENCNIENGTVFAPFCAVGMIAGSINGGSVTKCDVSGFMIGKESWALSGYIFGIEPQGAVTEEDNDASGVVYNN